MATYVRAFVAGFLSTLIFHQGLLHLLHIAGIAPVGGWNLTAVPPIGIPSVLSLAFWGGLWGCLLWLLVMQARPAKRWLWAILWGAVLPSAVALFIVFPLKGMPMAGGWDPKLIVGALLLNGVWGIGVYLLMRMMGRR